MAPKHKRGSATAQNGAASQHTNKPAAAEAPASQDLPAKDAQSFKNILQQYEHKQYKKGLKSADVLLKKHPSHGETVAMKGLILHSLHYGASLKPSSATAALAATTGVEQAHALIKKGLSLNIRSAVCWHVFGLMYRAERKYEDAIKCYQNALKRDASNLQIVKDLANLQIQRRMYTGFTESRRLILLDKASTRNNWIGYAMGCMLCQHYDKALQVLDTFEKTVHKPDEWTAEELKTKSIFERITYEDSELRLFKYHIMRQARPLQECLDFLNSIAEQVLDQQYVTEQRAELLLATQHYDLAQAEYRKLLAFNSDSKVYLDGLIAAMQITPTPESGAASAQSSMPPRYDSASTDRLLALFAELSTLDKYSAAARRRPLDVTHGAQFNALVDDYMRVKLRKGVPSLFVDLLPLYNDETKVLQIQTLCEQYVNQLRAVQKFDSQQTETESDAPKCLLWSLYFLAQHFEHKNDTTRALSIVTEALKSNPLNVDLNVLLARIYKHCGDFQAAYTVMNRARLLEKADRYLNVKTTRYALRAQQLHTANSCVQLFLREGEGLASLVDMQVMWYELSVASLHYKQRHFGRALKMLQCIERHFVDIYEDQFDFHGYVLRKTTLRAYVDMLTWQDVARHCKPYHKASAMMIDIYLRLHDAPLEELAAVKAIEDDATLNDEDKKSALKKLKKEQQRAKKVSDKAAADAAAKEAEETKARLAEKHAADRASNKTVAKKADALEESDPNGEHFMPPAVDALNEATKIIRHLQQFSSRTLQTHTLSLAVYRRQAKWMLGLRSVKQAAQCPNQAGDAQLHAETCAFLVAYRKALAADATSIHELAREIIDEECKSSPELGSGQSVDQMNESFLKQHSSSMPHRIAAARVLLFLDPVANESRAFSIVEDLSACSQSTTHQQAIAALEFMAESLKASPEQCDAFKAKAVQRFPLALELGASTAKIAD